MSLNEMHKYLIEALGIPHEAIQLVCTINGYSVRTMENILYVETGFCDFDQHKDAMT